MIELGFELRQPGPQGFPTVPWPLVLVRGLMLYSDFHRNSLLLTLAVVPGCRPVQDNCRQFRDDDSETPGTEEPSPGLPVSAAASGPKPEEARLFFCTQGCLGPASPHLWE